MLIVFDRTVIDLQLQVALFDYRRTSGEMAIIKGSKGSKSAEWRLKF